MTPEPSPRCTPRGPRWPRGICGSWSPKNYDGSYGGWTNLRSALRNSRNLATIRLGREAGIEKVRDVAKRAGIDTRIPGFPSVYIGAAAVYPVDLIAAYREVADQLESIFRRGHIQAWPVAIGPNVDFTAGGPSGPPALRV